MPTPFRQPVEDTEDQPPEVEQPKTEKPRLADLVRKKHPGVYDDMKDEDLEKAVVAKHPQYKDLATPPEPNRLLHPKPFKAEGPGYTAPVKIEPDNYGNRPDGTEKGRGFLGALKLPNGKVASEYSIADSEKLKDEKGNYIDYPSLVPTLTKEETQHVLDVAHKGGELKQSVKDKAEAHALKRKQQGLPLFATPGEERTDLHPDLERASSYDPNKKREPFDTSPLGWKSALKWATSPLTEAPSQFAKSVSEHINPESRTKGARAVGSAFVEGLGEAASSLTSPANLALVAAPPGISRAVGTAMVGHGAYRGTRGIMEGDPEEAIGGAVEGVLGGFGAKGHATPSTKEHPSVRQGREIPYRMEEATKETPKDIELPSEKPPNVDKPVEKPIEEVPKKGVKNPFEKKPEELKPEAYIGEERRLAESPVTEERRSPTRSPNLRSEFFPEEDLATRQTPAVRQNKRDIPYIDPDNPGAMKGMTRKQIESQNKFTGAVRPTEEVPSYAKEVSPEKPDITEGFGGSGHPESPDYTAKVLKGAGKGEPGLSVEEKEGYKLVVHRDPNGEPIAVAKVITGPDGKSLVHDLAADKTKGLLTGRAMQGIGNKLNELGATESSGTMSADAENFMGRMKGFLEKKNKASQFAEEVQPSAKYSHNNPELGGRQYDVGEGSTVGEAEAIKRGYKIPESPTVKEAAAEPRLSGAQLREKALAKKTNKEQAPELRAHDVKPSMSERATSRLQQSEDAARERIKKRGTFSGSRLSAGLPADDLADFAVIGATKIAKGVIKFADWSAEMIKDFGEAIKPHLKNIFAAAQNQHKSSTMKEMLNSLIENKGAAAEQTESYRIERAARFKEFEGIGGEGVDWAKKAMSTLKGEYEKVNPGEGLGLSRTESNVPLDIIKNSELPTTEKARGIAAIFKLMNGEKTLQPNEIELLDKIFEEHLGAASGPGAATPYDIKSGGKPITFSEAVSKTPKDFLTKLANFSSKTARSVLGTHIPGTAFSVHGIHEAVRNTLFGSSYNPFEMAKRFGDSAYYLARPNAAEEYTNLNLEKLSNAVNEGGLRVYTSDIGHSSFFKGSNILTKGINSVTDTKPLFEKVMTAFKLKSYEAQLEHLEKTGMKHDKAARAAGYAVNNIYGGLNLQELERSPNTQKLFRIAALAPDWLESTARTGAGMFKSLKNPTSPEGKIYRVGIANFLATYAGLNVLNAMNNNGRFMWQNEVGHELDFAMGKDSAGRTRYFSLYGPSGMKMISVPLEIAHAAVEGGFSGAAKTTAHAARSMASEPAQFITDMETNTDYAGRSLFGETKYGKKIPSSTAAANVLGSAASHVLPIGAEAGVNLSQGKISPEQFAAQVLQLPMKYKTPQRTSRLGKMRP